MSQEGGPLNEFLLWAVSAALNKKAVEIVLLDLKGVASFTDYFMICSGTNPRQIQAIADEIERELDRRGLQPLHIEGYNQSDWVLLDYVDFIVHIFSERARDYYSLERLWRAARRLPVPEDRR